MNRTRSGTRTSELALGAVTLALAACSPAREPQPAAPAQQPSAAAPVASAPQSLSGWEAGSRGKFHSLRFGVWLPFPDGKRWAIDDHKGEWLVAQHPQTGSTLRVKLLREDQAVNRGKCEAHARELDPSIPREEQGKVVESADQPGVLPGWDARVFSIVATKQPKAAQGQPAPPPVIEGQQVAFAAQVRRCLVWHFTTRAQGPGAEAAVGARLGEIGEMLRLIKLEDETQGPGKERPPF